MVDAEDLFKEAEAKNSWNGRIEPVTDSIMNKRDEPNKITFPMDSLLLMLVDSTEVLNSAAQRRSGTESTFAWNDYAIKYLIMSTNLFCCYY